MDETTLNQSSYMTTFSGIKFHMFDPQPDEIEIVDIAHALSMICRFTGHCVEFYSVAQHSCYVSDLLPSHFQLEGLLHDASEAYCNDLNRPIKHHPSMDGYRRLERIVEDAVKRKFRLPMIMSPAVKEIDNLIVCDEARQLLVPTPEWTSRYPSLHLSVNPWPPKLAEEEFLRRYHALAR